MSIFSSNVNVPCNIENEQPMYESVDPVVMQSKPNQGKNDKIITPLVRHSPEVTKVSMINSCKTMNCIMCPIVICANAN